MAILEKELAQLKLPDISGDSRVLRVGKVRYELSRLRLRDFHLPYSRITPISNVGLQVSISNAFAELDGDWRVKFLFIRSSGSFNLKVENVYIKITLSLGSDTTGKPTISTSDCSASISEVRVLFSGKLGWLYNLFHSVIESRLRKILESKVCDNVAKSVHNELQTYLQTLPVTAKIDGKTGIDYSLVASPRATAQSVDADLKGEFYSLAHHSTVPFPPLPLAFPSDHDRMVYFGASSYFFNTAGIAYHEAGALVFEITDAMVSGTSGTGLGKRFHLARCSRSSVGEAPTGNVSAVINVRSGRIVGSLDVGRYRGEQPLTGQEWLGVFLFWVPRDREARLDEGFPLPLLDRIQLSNILVKFY
ncbi:hypothetical protein IHE44_0004562, partial [Lamprotornis superbus]